MTTGAQRAEAQPDNGIADTDRGDWEVLQANEESAEAVETFEWAEEEPAESPARPRILAGLLSLLAVGWIGVVAWSLAVASPELTLSALVQWIAVASAPLVLLCVAWLAFGRTSRRETERFTQAVAAMRSESAALESLLAIVATRLEENHARLTNEAAKLMILGDEASDRLGRVTH